MPHDFKFGKGHTGHPLFRRWVNIISRCDNPKFKGYENYGARGITVCERWRDFVKFTEDMGTPPSLKHTVERIENDGNYEPGNCRWATRTDQNRNTRRNTMTVAIAAEIRSLKRQRISLGMIAEQLSISHRNVRSVIYENRWTESVTN